MATLTDYKGLDVVENATGDGGIALTDNFKELADRAPYQGSGNPGVNDDTTKGFAPGDTWLNTSTQVLWSCISNSTGAAVWKSVLKRTSTALELTPEESSEKVQVTGLLAMKNGKYVTFDNAAGSAPAFSMGVESTNSKFILGAGSGLASPKISVDGNKVGIGTDAPECHLHLLVSGTPMIPPSGTSFAVQSTGGPGAGTFITIISGPTGQSGLAFSDSTGAVPGAFFYDHSNNMLRIMTGAIVHTYLNSTGLSLGSSTPTARLDVSSDKIRLRNSKTPATSGAAGNGGDICWDANYVYICVAANTWKRAALATW